MERDGSASSVRFGAFTLIPDEQQLLRDGQPVLLTPKAFDLLAILASNPGRLLTKEQLMQAVWPDTVVEESNLTYNVFALRKALDDTAENSKYIETVPKRGYRFVAATTGVTSPGLKTRPTGPIGSAGPSGTNGTPSDAEASPSVQQPAAGAEPASGVDASTAAAVILPATASNHSILKGRWSAAAIGLAVGALAGAAMMFVAMRAPVPPLEPFDVQISPGVQLSEFASPFALSPDGRKLAFVGRGPDGVTRLWVRPMGEPKVRPIPGTEALLGGRVPPIFWSPDSQLVAFDASGQLKGVDVNDGAPRTLCDKLPGLGVGGSWNSEGIIVLGQPSSGLIRCSVADRQWSWLTRVDPDKGETAHVLPFFLPDQRHFFYVRVARNAPEGSGVYLGSIDYKPGAAVPPRLLATGFAAAYVPTKGTSMGRIVFLRNATLWAQAFDERALELRGDPTELATPVGSFIDGGFFSVSQNDVIAFRPPDKDFQLTWFDEKGNKTGALGDVGRYTSVDISPDDAHVAVAKEVVGSTIDQDIWVLETSRDSTTKVTSGPVLEDMPVWWSDSQRLMFTNGGDTGNLFEQMANSSSKPRALLETDQHKVPTSVSPDGKFLLYTVANNDRSRLDVWVLPLTGGAKAKPFPFIQGNLDQSDAKFSPDGQWVAYTTNESGRDQVRLKRFAEPSDGEPVDPEIPVSTTGGTAPRWSSDGKELYYFGVDGSVMSVDVVKNGATLSPGRTRVLFPLLGSRGDWDVVSDSTRFSDGRRFLIAIPTGADASAPFGILVNRLAKLSSAR